MDIASELIDKSTECVDDLIDKSVECVDGLADKADEIFIQVLSAFQKVLKIDQFNPNESFLALGGDSLMGFELINSIEQKLHIKLDLRELLRDSSVVGVTRYIHSVLSGTTGNKKAVNLPKECHLDDSIRYTAEYTKSAANCRRIFLTGGTGFLGAQLIHSMFRYYPHDGLEIYCLVRADSVEAAAKRLEDNLKHYHLWQDGMNRYLHPVIGSLSESKFGLDEKTWTRWRSAWR